MNLLTLNLSVFFFNCEKTKIMEIVNRNNVHENLKCYDTA